MRFRSLAIAVLSCCAAPAFAATTIDKVVVRGIDDETMVANIQAALSLHESVGKRLGETRFEYLLDQAQAEAAGALEPFGYYSPTISVDAPRATATADGQADAHVTVTVHVTLGEPVRVRNRDIHIDGEGGDDSYLQQDLADFTPRVGDVFDHTTYEASKLKIAQRLADRGYLDADFTVRKVEITRAAHAADIDLGWVSGIRYDMGPTTFHQDYFNPGLLDRLVYWQRGSYYHQGKLDQLRESLVGLDYFGSIDIQPDVDAAVGGEVPIDVNLALAKRDVYTYGVSYGTESGPGVRAGVERRYVNKRGHKLSVQLDYAAKRKELDTLYKIPAFKWLDGWYGIGSKLYDEQTDYIDTRRIDLYVGRSGQISDRLTANVTLHALHERWSYGTDGFDNASLLYPEIDAQYVDVDDKLFPRRGFTAHATLRGGLQALASDANFAQAQMTVWAYRGVGEADRFLFRGEAGTTLTGDLYSMPPSLRFFAGGDLSVRGYAYREVGPRLANGYALGGQSVLTGSAEFEHYFNAGPYGIAVFVDSGSAFNDNSPSFQTGAGLGFRYRSPIGPIRVDLAHGFDDPDQKVQLYLSIGVTL
ncbi:MAG: autotransporter assembly complex family protein [Pantoea sp.]|uniref:autotransporter assembly complex protein TamA n=1 Tax=Pantoea sp. TaxID=69393 RepID=UPI0039E3D96D